MTYGTLWAGNGRASDIGPWHLPARPSAHDRVQVGVRFIEEAAERLIREGEEGGGEVVNLSHAAKGCRASATAGWSTVSLG